MSHKYRAAIGRESPRPASREITTQLEPRRRNRLRFRLPRPHKQRKRFFAPFVRLQKGLAAGYPARGYCQWFGSQTTPPPSGTVWPRGQNQPPFTRVPAAMRPCPVHPAASINEPPAPHRARQVAAKSGMLQTRSRPQSCGFRPPVLAAIAKRRCAPGVGQPTCGAPDAAEPVEQKPLPPHAAGVRKPSFPADTSGGALPALTTCFGGYRQLVDNIPASAGLFSVDRA